MVHVAQLRDMTSRDLTCCLLQPKLAPTSANNQAATTTTVTTTTTAATIATIDTTDCGWRCCRLFVAFASCLLPSSVFGFWGSWAWARKIIPIKSRRSCGTLQNWFRFLAALNSRSPFMCESFIFYDMPSISKQFARLTTEFRLVPFRFVTFGFVAGVWHKL